MSHDLPPELRELLCAECVAAAQTGGDPCEQCTERLQEYAERLREQIRQVARAAGPGFTMREVYEHMVFQELVNDYNSGAS